MENIYRIICILVISTVIKSQGPDNPEEVCIGYEDFEKIGFGADYSCTGYYECEGEIGYEEYCPEGQQFNYETNDCDDEEYVQCVEPDFTDETDYPDNQETDYPEETDPTIRTTTRPPTTTANSVTTQGPIEDVTCPDNRPGEIIFFPASNCSEYYICANGNKLKMTCLEDFTWNQDLQKCDYPIFSKCSVRFFKFPANIANPKDNFFFILVWCS